MKQHLTDLLKYTDRANSEILESIKNLGDKSECERLFSHLITSQDKWYNRIFPTKEDVELTWFDPVFSFNELSQKWKQSIDDWISLVDSKSEDELENWIVFSKASDGKKLKVKVKDIVLQINFHSIHHRAQINKIIRQQGFVPPFTDYILNVIEPAD